MKRRIINKITATALSVVTLLSAVPVYADTTGTQETAEAGSKDATVLYDMSADYTITIPKTIKLDSTKETDYSVKVEGDIPSDEKVHVAPVDAIEDTEGVNFYMKDQSTVLPKSDVTATVTQDKTEWSFKEVANGTETTDNKVSATDLTSGTWKGNFAFEINMMSLLSISVNATDSNGDNLNASATAIVGEEKENLLNELESSGLVSSADDVDALIDVNSDEFDDLANATFDVSDIANTGDKVVILHYDETKGEWEYIGEDTVGEDGTVSGDFTSFSPIAFVKVTDDGTYEHIHNYDENGICYCEYTSFTLTADNYTMAGIERTGNVVVPANFEYEDTWYRMDAIGKSAFKSSSITSIEIPSTVTSIGSYTFQDCSSLESVIIPDSLSSIGRGAFYRCSALTDIILPDSVNSIEESTFMDCESLASISIPNNVASIGDHAFYRCTSLEDVIIPNSVISIGGVVFDDTLWLSARQAENPLVIVNNILINGKTCSGDIVIPDGVTAISGSAFSYDTELTGIDIPGSVVSIGNTAFKECSALSSIKLSAGVTSIGYNAFQRCSSLSSIVIPDSVTTIGSYAFDDCTSLSSIEIPDSVSSIDQYTFSGCTGLSSVNISDGVTSIGSNAFKGCTSLTDIVIPNSITTIESNAFKSCSKLSTIYIPSSVTTISASSQSYSPFYDCSSSLKIYCEVSEVQSSWGTYWNYYMSKALSVTYDISREDYETNYK